MTTGQNSREILLGVDSLAGDLGGLLVLSFLGHRVLLEARADQLSDDRYVMVMVTRQALEY